MAVLYVAAILFKQSAGQMDEFSSIPKGMETLFFQAILGDPGPQELAKKILPNSGRMYVVFVVVIVFANFTLMNMLICLVCEVIPASNGARCWLTALLE